MAFFKPELLRTMLFSAFFVYRFLSLGIIDYPAGHPRRIVGLMYSTITSCAYISMLYITHNDLLKISDTMGSSMARFSYLILFYLGTGRIVINFVINFIRNKEHRNCITELIDIEAALKSLGSTRSYRSLIIQEMQHTFVMMLIIFVASILNYNSLVRSDNFGKLHGVLLWIFFVGPVYLTALGSFTICIFIRMMTYSFENLNSFMESMKITNPDHWTRIGNLIRIEAIIEDKKRLENLRCIRIIYTRLVKLAKLWVELNGVYIISSICVVIWVATLNAYGMYLNYLGSSDSGKYIHHTLSIVSEITKIWIIVCTAAALTAEASRTRRILMQHLEPIAFLRSEVQEFSLQLIQNPLRLSAGGLFDLDYSLIHTIVSTVVTYIVVLAQTYGVDGDNSSNSSTA